MVAMAKAFCTRAARLIAGAALLLAAASASAETLMMPDRDARLGTQVVVWGVSTLPNGTAFTLDYGDLSAPTVGNVGDRSYIAFAHTYATQGTFTAMLTVGAEVATVDVQVFDPALLPGGVAGAANRNLGVNMAIEDGLRFLWTNQSGRAANFPASPTTRWPNVWSSSEAALVMAGFQNQGYQLPSDGSPPTGVYEKYIVQRGLNHVIASLTTIPLGVTPQGDDPCVGTPAADLCTGLYDRRQDIFHQNYTTGIATIALAASGVLGTRTVAAADVPGNFSGNYVVGKTYGEILQRMVNALAWGQIDSGAGRDRGGWYYNFNAFSSDGSTIGWVLLGLFDAEAAGVIVPAWVKTEHAFAVDAYLNNDGSTDYQANNNPASNSAIGPAKGGIGLQGLFFTGELAGARVDAVAAYIDSWWTGFGGIGFDSWGCGFGVNVNKACGYTMFNNFKGLKLQGIQTLPNVGRPAGPGLIPANDWHEDYKDWLVANQTSPATTGGGNWNGMRLSAILDGRQGFTTAIAELILSPVALVLPDPVQFAELGLQHAPWTASPNENTDPAENLVDANHTVTARALSVAGTPVPGASVDFEVLVGPNLGLICSGIVTDGDGEADCTYTSSVAGTDTIEASIGDFLSNNIDKIWIPPNLPPVAVCQNVTRECVLGAQTTDVTAASFDGGTTDPDMDLLEFLMTPAPPYALSPPGQTIGELTVTDPLGEFDMCLAVFTVVDTTPPTPTAALVPVGDDDDDDEGRFRVEFGCGDTCDPNVVTTAELNGIPVTNGQIVELEIDDDEMEVDMEDGVLEIEAPSFELVVSCTDAAGNVGIAMATPEFPGDDDDDDSSSSSSD